MVQNLGKHVWEMNAELTACSASAAVFKGWNTNKRWREPRRAQRYRTRVCFPACPRKTLNPAAMSQSFCAWTLCLQQNKIQHTWNRDACPPCLLEFTVLNPVTMNPHQVKFISWSFGLIPISGGTRFPLLSVDVEDEWRWLIAVSQMAAASSEMIVAGVGSGVWRMRPTHDR